MKWLWLIFIPLAAGAAGYVVANYVGSVVVYQDFLQDIWKLVFIGFGLGIVEIIGQHFYIRSQWQRVRRLESIVQQKEAKLQRDRRDFEQLQKEGAGHVDEIGSRIFIAMSEAEQKSEFGMQIRQVELALAQKYGELIERKKGELNSLRGVVRKLAKALRDKMYSGAVKPLQDAEYELLIEGPVIRRSKPEANTNPDA